MDVISSDTSFEDHPERDDEILHQLGTLLPLANDPSDAIRASVSKRLVSLDDYAITFATDEILSLIEEECVAEIKWRLLDRLAQASPHTPHLVPLLTLELLGPKASHDRALGMLESLECFALGAMPVLASLAHITPNSSQRERYLDCARKLSSGADRFVQFFDASTTSHEQAALCQFIPQEFCLCGTLLFESAPEIDLSTLVPHPHTSQFDRMLITPTVVYSFFGVEWLESNESVQLATLKIAQLCGRDLERYGARISDLICASPYRSVKVHGLLALAKIAPQYFPALLNDLDYILSITDLEYGSIASTLVHLLAQHRAYEHQLLLSDCVVRALARSAPEHSKLLLMGAASLDPEILLPQLVKLYLSAPSRAQELALAGGIISLKMKIPENRRYAVVNLMRNELCSEFPHCGIFIEAILAAQN